MKKILVIPNKDNIEELLNTNIDGLLLPIKDLSCNYDRYFTIDEIKKFLNKTSKEINIIINKIMHNKDIDLLKRTLEEINKLNISKILFYDLSVMNICNNLNIKKDLVVYQEHLNASDYSNNFYKRRGIKYSVITNDITIDEINEISKNNKLMLISYGYLPIFYSRRYLITNYLEYVGIDKRSDIYYIKHIDKYYPIKEEDEGCVIYTHEPINLINEIDNINVDYLILNSFNIDNNTFFKVLDDYINNKKNNDNNYLGFLKEKTVYKVVDYEKN